MTGAAYPRQLRLLRPAQYKRVFDDARYRVSRPQLLVLANNNELGHPRLGLVVSKKSCRLANARNRLKRLLRESFRLHQQELAGLDIVVLSRRGLSELDNAAITELAAKTWTRLLRQAQPPADSACLPPVKT